MTRPSWQDFGTYDESEHARLWDGVVGAWCPSLGPTGSRLHDHSRSVNWGTLTNMDNATDWVVDTGQYALDFDGVNDRVALSTQASFLGSRTLSAWIRMTATNVRGGIFGTRSGGNGWVLRTSTNSTIAAYHTGQSTIEGSANSLVNGKWHSATYTYTPAGVMNLFVDGVRIGGTTGYSEAVLGTAALIADEDGTSPFPAGQIAEVTLWNRALTANEVRDLYLLGRGGMFERRRRSRRRAIEQAAGFKAYWVQQKSRVIGGGV